MEPAAIPLLPDILFNQNHEFHIYRNKQGWFDLPIVPNKLIYTYKFELIKHYKSGDQIETSNNINNCDDHKMITQFLVPTWKGRMIINRNGIQPIINYFVLSQSSTIKGEIWFTHLHGKDNIRLGNETFIRCDLLQSPKDGFVWKFNGSWKNMSECFAFDNSIINFGIKSVLLASNISIEFRPKYIDTQYVYQMHLKTYRSSYWSDKLSMIQHLKPYEHIFHISSSSSSSSLSYNYAQENGDEYDNENCNGNTKHNIINYTNLVQGGYTNQQYQLHTPFVYTQQQHNNNNNNNIQKQQQFQQQQLYTFPHTNQV
jgi:hypothetical protein